MGNSDARPTSHHGHGRKYLTLSERQRVLAAARQLPDRARLFLELLIWSGARISEALAVTAGSFDLELNTVTLITLKRRKVATRAVPLPPELMDELDGFFGLRTRQQFQLRSCERLWTFHRVTGWRIVKSVMDEAGICGMQARPHGLRHGFGVGALQAGVPITLLKRWMGHARLSTTEIYLDVVGAEEIAFAQRFWKANGIGKPSVTAGCHGPN